MYDNGNINTDNDWAASIFMGGARFDFRTYGDGRKKLGEPSKIGAIGEKVVVVFALFFFRLSSSFFFGGAAGGGEIFARPTMVGRAVWRRRKQNARRQ